VILPSSSPFGEHAKLHFSHTRRPGYVPLQVRPKAYQVARAAGAGADSAPHGGHLVHSAPWAWPFPPLPTWNLQCSKFRSPSYSQLPRQGRAQKVKRDREKKRATPAGFEPATSSLGGKHPIH
jgi:hypothetical protein